MLKIFILIDLLCMFIIMGSILKKTNFLKVVTLSISSFLFLYAIFSGLFFLFGSFSFRHVIGTITILFIPLTVYCLVKFHAKIIFEKTSLCTTTIPLILAAFTLFVSMTKFEVYDTGQDQGLYQAEAIELYMGNYEVQHDFEEYKILKNPVEKEDYFDMLIHTIPGYYPLSPRNFPTVDKTEVLSDVSGMYHGVQTFPALLALGAKLFGLKNMAQIQSVFFVCSVLLLYFAIRNLNISLTVNAASLSVFILSPLAVWISKSSFTEMFLTLIVSCYLFLLTETDSKAKRLLLGLPLFTFPYLHVSFLMIYPIFIIINILLYLYDSKKEYICLNFITCAGLCSGYFMMSEIAPQYFFDNCSMLYFKNIITMDNFMYWIYGGSLAVSAFSLCLLKLKNPNGVYKKIIAFSRFLPIVSVGLLGIIFIHGILIGFFRTSESNLLRYWGTGLSAFQHLTLYAFSMATGFILIPYLFYQLIKKNKIFLSEPLYYCIYLLFIYCILFYSAVLRKEIIYYYYYSRYLVFYIPIICILLAIIYMHSNKTIYWIVFQIAICGMLPFTSVLILEKDDTMLEWDILIDLAETVDENSAIILKSPEIQKTLGVQLRALADASIFPKSEDIESQINLLKEHYANIYFLSDTPAAPKGYEIVYRNHYFYSKNPINILKGTYPLTIPKTEKELILYKTGNLYNTINVLESNTGVINATKQSGYIMSSGNEGIVMFGPYISMPEGDYYLHVPIKVVSKGKESLGKCYIGVSGTKAILPFTPLEEFLKQDGEQFYLDIPFHIDEYTEKIEFIIQSTKDSVFSIYSYDILMFKE